MSTEVLNEILRSKVIAVVRIDSGEQLKGVVDALVAGGINIIELTMTIPGAIDKLRELVKIKKKGTLIGMGTVLDVNTAREVIDAGADFVVSPVTNPDIIKLCKSNDITVCPGAFTPTEIYTAWEAGADIVKIFPAGALGPGYFKNIKDPLPDIRIMPTGGVSTENAADFIKNGACAVGIGGNLVNSNWIKNGEYDKIKEAAILLIDNIK